MENIFMYQKLQTMCQQLNEDDLKIELRSRLQTTFKPIPGQNDETISEMKCSQCGMLPLQMLACCQCRQIYCTECVQTVLKKPLDQRLCKSQQCNLEDGYYPFNWFKMTQESCTDQKILNVKQTHSCKLKFKDQQKYQNPDSIITKDYNVFELAHHIENECPISKFCECCEIEFETQEQFHLHIKTLCPEVSVKCLNCKDAVERKFYSNPLFHTCHSMNVKEMNQTIDKLQSREQETKQYILQMNQELYDQHHEITYLKSQVEILKQTKEEAEEKEKKEKEEEQFCDEIYEEHNEQ